MIQKDQSGNGSQIYISNPNGWTFVFFHGDPLVSQGQSVVAGTPVLTWWPTGAAAFASATGGNISINSVDMALMKLSDLSYASPFEYFSDNVLTMWKNRGFDISNSQISKVERDSKPCSIGSDGERFSGQATESDFLLAKKIGIKISNSNNWMVHLTNLFNWPYGQLLPQQL